MDGVKPGSRPLLDRSLDDMSVKFESDLIVNVQEFRDDDAAYVNWRTEHEGGYVINIQRTLHPSDARLHRADCRSIAGTNARPGPWTSAYIKVCADEVADLDAWAVAHNLSAIRGCSMCHPARGTFPPVKLSSPGSALSTPPVVTCPGRARRVARPTHRRSLGQGLLSI